MLDIWNRDGGSNCDQGYKCVPFYLSNLGYGVLVNTPDYVRFDVGMESVRHVQFSVEDEKLSYIVVGGEDAKDVLSRYTALIGRSPVPPVWTFGLWLSTSWIPDSTEKTALAAIDKMHEYGIPLSVYHFDARWMDDFHDCNFIWSDRFGDARHMIDEIHKRGIKVCVWINPYVSQISRLFAEGMEGGYFIKNKNGDVWQTDMWMCGTAYVDFTNPAAANGTPAVWVKFWTWVLTASKPTSASVCRLISSTTTAPTRARCTTTIPISTTKPSMSCL